MQPDIQEAPDATDSHNVLQYLTRNPDFFNQHSEILTRLRIPHHTGAAVSLVEKQISVLRKQCNSLETKLSELISVARDNEALHQRLHVLIQDVISAASLDDICSLMKSSLTENFQADDAKILLIDRVGGTRHKDRPDRFVAADDPELALFEHAYECGETLCGVPGERVREFLFTELEQESVGSAAVIPLYHEGNLGLAILTSRDENRFDSQKGVMFLNQLGEVLSRKIATLL